MTTHPVHAEVTDWKFEWLLLSPGMKAARSAYRRFVAENCYRAGWRKWGGPR